MTSRRLKLLLFLFIIAYYSLRVVALDKLFYVEISHHFAFNTEHLFSLHQVAAAILEVPSGVSRVHASRRTFQMLADRSCMLPVIHSVVFSSLKDKVRA